MFIELYIDGILYTRSEHEWNYYHPSLADKKSFERREQEIQSIIEALKRKHSTAIAQANRWEFFVVFKSQIKNIP